MSKNNIFKIILATVLIVSTIMMITGCSNNELANIPNVSDYNLSLSVLDESDNPIKGATVTLDGTSKTSDSNGIVTFSKPDGSYDYNVTYTGYDTIYDTILVDGNDVSIDLSMTQLITTYNINFTINDSSDKPIENAIITLDGEDKNTDGNGMATFSKQDGTYNYSITASDYVDITNSSLTVSGADLTETVSMQDTPPAGYIGIYDWEDLYDIREDFYEDYILMNDLDSSTLGYDHYASNTANSGLGWSPIGNYVTNFRGTFDGNNFTISDLYIDRPDEEYIGLFGYGYSAQLVNINIDSVEITGQKYVAGIIGDNHSGTVDNCNVTGSITGTSLIGGVVGYSDSIIKNGSFNGQITGIAGDGNISAIGGITGHNDQGELNSNNSNVSILVDGFCTDIGGIVGHNSGNIINCSSSGTLDINSDNGDSFGGLVGINMNSGRIENSSSLVSVTVTGTDPDYIGGLVGNNYSAVILESYATGDVSGDSECGGLVGYNYYGSIVNNYSTGNVNGNNNIGGLVGFNGNGSTIGNCFSIGTVTGTGTGIGGLVGKDTGEYIAYCYYDSETSGQIDTGKGLSRTTKQMKEGSADTTIDGDAIYTDWYTSIWNFGSNTDYPSLSWE